MGSGDTKQPWEMSLDELWASLRRMGRDDVMIARGLDLMRFQRMSREHAAALLAVLLGQEADRLREAWKAEIMLRPPAAIELRGVSLPVDWDQARPRGPVGGAECAHG